MIISHPPDTRSRLLLATPHWWQNQTEETKTAWPGKGLTCYDCCHYKARSDTEADNTDENTAGKHTCTDDMLKTWGKNYFFVQLACSVYTTTNWIVLQSPKDKLGFKGIGNEVTGTVQRKWESFHSSVLLHPTARCPAEAGSPPYEMQVSQRIFICLI